MAKLIPTKPLLIMLYGFPGSGKTFFARQLSESLAAAHLQADRIRSEVLEHPTYSADETKAIMGLMDYMTGEFLSAGVSVIYDANAMRLGQRRALRNMAAKLHAETMLLWLQIDVESAWVRVAKRDRRKADDRYAQPLDRPTFDTIARHMQHPELTEQHLVISGKHVFNTQRNSVLRRMLELGLISGASGQQVAKPGLVNLVPNPAAGRVDYSRRNIIIR